MRFTLGKGGEEEKEKSRQRQLRKEEGRAGWGQRSAERPSSAALQAGGVSGAFASFFFFFCLVQEVDSGRLAGISRKPWRLPLQKK